MHENFQQDLVFQDYKCQGMTPNPEMSLETRKERHLVSAVLRAIRDGSLVLSRDNPLVLANGWEFGGGSPPTVTRPDGKMFLALNGHPMTPMRQEGEYSTDLSFPSRDASGRPIGPASHMGERSTADYTLENSTAAPIRKLGSSS